MKILFVVSEVEGLVKTGGLADVGRALPEELARMGYDVRIVVPFYRQIARDNQAISVVENQELHTHDRSYPFSIKQLDFKGLTVYGIDFPLFFDRDGIYSDGYHAYPDNAERFAFFSMAALSAARAVNFQPDIVHCNDWHTALTPFFLKKDKSGFFNKTKSVLTIHNGAYQCQSEFAQAPFLHSFEELSHRVDNQGAINFLKTGIEFADKINAVSPNYAQELLTPMGSHNLFDNFKSREYDMSGILNGCDYNKWDPSTDPHIAANYSLENLENKKQCKEALQAECKLKVDSKIPVLGLVCRLTEQKGFGFLIPAIWNLMQHNVQVVIVGTGDPSIAESLHQCAEQHPDKLVFIEGFSDGLAHRVEAGIDFFLMPSLFEPCGLNQMYSLAYGTIPIVRGVGGLRDTVIDRLDNPYLSTGFVFDQPDSAALLNCIQRALLFYYESPTGYVEMQRRAMQTKFTWKDAANNYIALYQDISEGA